MPDFLVPSFDWMALHLCWLDTGLFVVAPQECLPPIGLIRHCVVLMISAALLAGMLRMSTVPFSLACLSAFGFWAITMAPSWFAGAEMGNTAPGGFWLQAGVIASGLALLCAACCWPIRPHPSRRVSLLAGLAGMLLLALLVSWPLLSAFDLYLQQQALLLSAPSFDGLMLVLTLLGDSRLQFVLFAVLCSLLVLYRTHAVLLFVGISLAGSTLLNVILKQLVARSRPDLLPQPLDGYSLPSGHSLRAFVFCLVVAVLLGIGRQQQLRAGLLALACVPAAMIGFSRVYLTAHWPTDVLASMLLAAFSCSAALAMTGTSRLAASMPGQRFWQLEGGLSLLAAVLFVFWSFAAAASRYNLLQGVAACCSSNWR